MKKLLLFISFLLYAFTCPAPITYLDRIVSTNIVVISGSSSNVIGPGSLSLSKQAGPGIVFSQSGGGPYNPANGFLSFGQIGAGEFGWFMGNGFATPRSLKILGNLWVDGSINTVTPIVWQTNYVTNAVFATTATNAPDGNPLASMANIFWQTNATPGGTVNLYTNWVVIDAGHGGLKIMPGSLASDIILGDSANYILPTSSRGATIGGGRGQGIGGSDPSLSAYDTIAGGQNNLITNAATATISGGLGNTIKRVATTSVACTIGGGQGNLAQMQNATVSGGIDNTAGAAGKFSSASGPTVSGGNRNAAYDDASVVSGGENNTADGPAAVVSGGGFNLSSGYGSVVSGGLYNDSTNNYSVVSGGLANTNYGAASVIAGGYSNSISSAASYSFSAGYGATVTHYGAFVWSDDEGTSYPSIDNNIVQFRAAAGLKLDGGNFQGNGIALTNQVVGPTPIANQVILWYSNNVLWATGPNATKPVLTGL